MSFLVDAMTHDRRRVSGMGWAVLSASAFGLSGSLARALMDAGWSAGAAVAARILLGAAVLLPAAIPRLRGRWGLLRRNAPLVLGYGLVAVAGCQLAYFNAVAHLPVGVALLVEYTAPVAVVLWLWARHGQRPGRLTAAGAVLAAVGLVLVLDLVGGVPADAVGVLWALAAMVGAAAYFVLSGRTDDALPGIVLAAGALLVGGAVLLLAGLVGVVPMVVSDRPVLLGVTAVAWWVPVLALGIVSAALAYVSGIVATRKLGSRLASFVALIEVVAAMAFAAVLLGETPDPHQLVGGALILGGIVVVRLGEFHVEHRAGVSQPGTRVDGPPGRDHDRDVSNPEGAIA
jgi:drug/metabolite transporter (DMT)-like permease